MRKTVLVAFTLLVGAFFVGGSALAAEEESAGFPDLPGMKLADEATRGEVAPSASSGRRVTEAPTDSTSDGTEVASASSDGSAPDASLISELPGTGQIPVIDQMKVGLASGRSKADTMPRGLAALAALGTIVSVGSFLLFRDRILGR